MERGDLRDCRGEGRVDVRVRPSQAIRISTQRKRPMSATTERLEKMSSYSPAGGHSRHIPRTKSRRVEHSATFSGLGQETFEQFEHYVTAAPIGSIEPSPKVTVRV
jgi:hypothetical protein